MPTDPQTQGFYGAVASDARTGEKGWHEVHVVRLCPK